MSLSTALRDYASRFDQLGGEHAIASPLGAWLVLAVAASGGNESEQAELAASLGLPVDEAMARVGVLLERPHEAVTLALAAWNAATPHDLAGWRRTLPAGIETGEVPDQATADAWAARNTDGMIRAFPLSTSGAAILLASALATRVTWRRPFDVVPAEALRRGWATELRTVLAGPTDRGDSTFIATTRQAGDVAVHRAVSENHLDVVSVIAAAHVEPTDVLAAAHDIATAGDRGTGKRRLADLNAGEHELWTIEDRPAEGSGERFRAVLPCWRAESSFDLLAMPGLALAQGAAAIARRAGLPGFDAEARQTAVASFGRRGFEAAAVTAMNIAFSGAARRPGILRTATLRFAHPYAVVAVATANRPELPWHGIPVFAAWIAAPESDVFD